MVVGTRLQDRYVLDERIAVGGMGSIMSATDERLGRHVAVKMLKEELAHDPRFVERFRREARAVASLSHPNIANVFDYGEHDGHHFIVMELAPGKDLGRLLRDDGRLSPERAARIGSQICEALSHAHASGIVHRDVKPANAIVDANDRVKVTDFGIARAMGEATLTATGSVMGTAHYISPEQAGGAQIEPASDQYSMGIVLYEMLTGDVPFSGDSPLAVAMRHTSDQIPPPSEKNPKVPSQLDGVVKRATQKNPADRYPDARDMGAAMVAAVSGPATDPLGGPTMPMAGGAMAGAGAATMVEGARSTATLADPADAQPLAASARRWNPERIGLFAVIALLAIGIIAALIFLAGTLSGDPTSTGGGQPKHRASGGGKATQQASPTETQAASGTIPTDLVGKKGPEAEKSLQEAGFTSVSLARASSYSPDLDPGTVVASDPRAGSTVALSDPVTLYVNPNPPPPSGDKHDKPPGKAKGHGKHD